MHLEVRNQFANLGIFIIEWYLAWTQSVLRCLSSEAGRVGQLLVRIGLLHHSHRWSSSIGQYAHAIVCQVWICCMLKVLRQLDLSLYASDVARCRVRSVHLQGLVVLRVKRLHVAVGLKLLLHGRVLGVNIDLQFLFSRVQAMVGCEGDHSRSGHHQ